MGAQPYTQAARGGAAIRFGSPSLVNIKMLFTGHSLDCPRCATGVRDHSFNHGLRPSQASRVHRCSKSESRQAIVCQAVPSAAAAAIMDAPQKVARPDANGRYGKFGGKYVPETLIAALTELEEEYNRALKDPKFQVLALTMSVLKSVRNEQGFAQSLSDSTLIAGSSSTVQACFEDVIAPGTRLGRFKLVCNTVFHVNQDLSTNILWHPGGLCIRS